jgi:hypothetical protein
MTIVGGTLSLSEVDANTFKGAAFQILIGNGTTYARAGSVLYSNAGAAGNVNAGETDLMSYTLPVETLDNDNTFIEGSAFGTFANNINAKTIKVYFGSAIIGTLTALTTSQNWQIDFKIMRSALSNQYACVNFSTDDAAFGAPTYTTSTSEDITNTIILKFTGTGVATDDIVQNGMIVKWAKSA